VRAVVQRVTRASVEVNGADVAGIGPGLLALVGFARGDHDEDLVYVARKIPHLRIFPDEDGKFSLSSLHLGLSVLVVSQFTLFGDVRRGNRPSFTGAEDPAPARALYERFILFLKAETGEEKVQSAPFGAMMKVCLVNDGPVTIWVDSRGGREKEE
jgi:D-tyrosyl-tRNA(Tyr) deacylase